MHEGLTMALEVADTAAAVLNRLATKPAGVRHAGQARNARDIAARLSRAVADGKAATASIVTLDAMFDNAWARADIRHVERDRTDPLRDERCEAARLVIAVTAAVVPACESVDAFLRGDEAGGQAKADQGERGLADALATLTQENPPQKLAA